ncbi:MAG: 8-oxo-dGTP diphosphatase [Patescibacteria group bacterium]|nr:8-oxo-dGTP diphosphatase [Patescibacteria group bacterium]
MEDERFKIFASVHIFFIKNDLILLSLRKNISSDGLYSVVAGHKEANETITMAMIRESKEEVDVDIEPCDIQIKTVCHSYNSKNNREYIQFYAICKKWKGEIINNEPDKCGDVKFFPINALPTNMVPYIRSAIKNVFNDVNYYEYGWSGEDK